MANDIVLTLDYEIPPAAEDLGEVLGALARDYRGASGGRVLVVTRVQSGSIILAVTDAVLAAAPSAAVVVGGAVATMAAVNTIDKFAENLKKWFGRAKTDEGKKRLYKKGKKSPGQRSVEAIISTAAKTRSRAKVKHTKANGEMLEAEVAPGEAIEIRKAALPRSVKSDDAIAAGRAFAVQPEVKIAIEKLRQAGSQSLSLSQIQAVVEIIVSALQMSGTSHALPEIASQLESSGLFDFAQAVRAHIRGPGKNLEPPLTTT